MVQPAQKATSTQSTSSIVIRGPSARQGSGSSLELIKRAESGFEVYDAACALVYCPTHKKFGFCKINSWKGLFLPITVVSPLDGFEHGIHARMKQLLQHPESHTGFIGHRVKMDSMEYTRIEVPVVHKFVTRVTFKVTITGSTPNLCCKDVFSMEWMTAEEVAEQRGHFWGPEVAAFVSGHVVAFQELTCRSDLSLGEVAKNNALQAGYSDADISRIYNDYFQHIFPSTRMSRSSLIKYLRGTGMVNVDDFKQTDTVANVFSPDPNHFFTFQEFLTGLAAVDSESPIGTTKGFRSFRQVAVNKDSMENVEIDDSFRDVTRLSKGAGAAKEICFKCEEESLTYASYAVTLNPDSIVVDPLAIVFNEEDQRKVAERVLSREQVDHTSIGNMVIRWIHDHAEIHAPIKPFPKHTGTHDIKPDSLWSHDPKKLADHVIRMCHFVKRVMMHEPRLVEKLSPCYVIGSLFGSIADLLTMERLFWKRGIQFEAADYIFLGNYIELGDHSLEVLFYLLAIKSLAPHKVTLLRGQTEQRKRLRKVKDELKTRFGDTELMRNLRTAICSVFDVMPIAALVNGHEFLTSSQLPVNIKNLNEINLIPCPLSDPDSNPIARDLTAAVAGSMNESAVEQQMNRLGIGSLIRSFEWSTRSVKRQLNGRIISMISSSNMKQSGNPATLILINNGRIRSIIIQDPKFPVRSGSQLSLLLSTNSSISSDSAHSPTRRSSSLSLLNMGSNQQQSATNSPKKRNSGENSLSISNPTGPSAHPVDKGAYQDDHQKK